MLVVCVTTVEHQHVCESIPTLNIPHFYMVAKTRWSLNSMVNYSENVGRNWSFNIAGRSIQVVVNGIFTVK